MNPIQNIYLYYIDLFVGYLDILCYIYIYICPRGHVYVFNVKYMYMYNIYHLMHARAHYFIFLLNNK
jgi:hypothetical protein